MVEIILERNPEVELTPAEYLTGLPHEGFESDEQRLGVIEKIDAIGFPVNNFRSLHFEKNIRGRENVLGSWGTGNENYGQFSVYELLDRQVPEKQIGTITHESAHANSALVPENAHLFGGEEQRQQAQDYLVNLAEQSLRTGKFVDGYQALLAKQYAAGEIDQYTFIEETQAIVSELAITNRAHLAQVEAAQHEALRKMPNLGNVEPVNLISQKDEKGDFEVDGIDRQLITLLRGVSTYEELEEHATELKQRFYPRESREVADQRRESRMVVTPLHLVMEVQLVDDEDEIKKAEKVKKYQNLGRFAISEASPN